MTSTFALSGRMELMVPNTLGCKEQTRSCIRSLAEDYSMRWAIFRKQMLEIR
jgi:hypothetical protein